MYPIYDSTSFRDFLTNSNLSLKLTMFNLNVSLNNIFYTLLMTHNFTSLDRSLLIHIDYIYFKLAATSTDYIYI